MGSVYVRHSSSQEDPVGAVVRKCRMVTTKHMAMMSIAGTGDFTAAL